MALLMIIIDISAWQSLRQEALRDADKMSMFVGRYLPYEDSAKQAFIQYANEYNESSVLQGRNLRVLLDEGDYFISPSSVRLSLAGAHSSMIDFIFQAFRGEQMILQVREESEARLVPIDSAVIFSDALNLRPLVPFNLDDYASSDSGYASFGDAFEWGYSEYFNLAPRTNIVPSPEPEAPFGWRDWWESEQFNKQEFRTWLTQSCYSPVITPLKLAAGTIADAILQSPVNKLAVMASPGDNPDISPFSIVKAIDFQSRPLWSNYFESPSGICDEACVYYSSFSDKFSIPLIDYSTEQTCEDIFDINPLTDPDGHYPNPLRSKLSSCFNNGELSIWEAIYYRSVRRFTHEADFSNITNSSLVALSMLIESEKEDKETSVTNRGNLSSASSRILFLLVDALPDVSIPSAARLIQLLEATLL